jgi:hypothetical protein
VWLRLCWMTTLILLLGRGLFVWLWFMVTDTGQAMMCLQVVVVLPIQVRVSQGAIQDACVWHMC